MAEVNEIAITHLATHSQTASRTCRGSVRRWICLSMLPAAYVG